MVTQCHGDSESGSRIASHGGPSVLPTVAGPAARASGTSRSWRRLVRPSDGHDRVTDHRTGTALAGADSAARPGPGGSSWGIYAAMMMMPGTRVGPVGRLGAATRPNSDSDLS